VDFLIVALTTRIVGTMFLASLLGAGLWLAGIVLLASFWAGNHVAAELNTILAFGTGAGIIAWVVELREEELTRADWLRPILLLALALGMTAAGLRVLGAGFLTEQASVGYAAHGEHGTPEIVGAWIGAMFGATLLPGVRGAWRVAHRREP